MFPAVSFRTCNPILTEKKIILTPFGTPKSQSKRWKRVKGIAWGKNGLEVDFASRVVQNFNSSTTFRRENGGEK
jgi:hypothetical protein